MLIIVGAVGTTIAFLLVWAIQASWRAYWSLDRVWQRAARDGSKLQLVRRAFMRCVDEGFSKRLAQITQAGSRLVAQAVNERSFFRHVLPATPITNDDLDMTHDTAVAKVIEKESYSSGAIGMSIGTAPMTRYTRGPRARVIFERILTPKFVRDTDEFRVSEQDPRNMFYAAGTSIADELDEKFIACVTALLEQPGKVLPETQRIQWCELDATINRDSLATAFKYYAPDDGAPIGTVLLNRNTFRELALLGDATSITEIDEGTHELVDSTVRWVVTSKTKLVPDGTVFIFGPTAKLGKAYDLEPPSLYFDRQAYMMSYYAYIMTGCVLMSVGHVTRVDFMRSRVKLTADKPGEPDKPAADETTDRQAGR